MMKKQVILLFNFVALLVMAATAVAGERAEAFSLSPFIGGYTFDGVQHLQTAPTFGLRLGYDLTQNWGVEAVGDYLATKGTVANQSVNAMSYRLDILYNFTAGGPLVPYLAAGGGGMTYGHGSNGFKVSNTTTDATANAGFGIKYFMTDSIALRGDARQSFVLEEPNSPKYNWEYSAGFTFLFGGKSKAAPVVAKHELPTPPPLEPTSKLTISPIAITKGQSTTLSWTSQHNSLCYHAGNRFCKNPGEHEHHSFC